MIKHDEVMLTNDGDKSINKNKEYKRKYYEKNKEKLIEKVKCELCGGEYQKSSKSKHENTRRHNELLLVKKKDEEIDKLKNELQKINDI